MLCIAARRAAAAARINPDPSTTLHLFFPRGFLDTLIEIRGIHTVWLQPPPLSAIMGDNFEVHQQPLTSSHSSAQAAITDSTLPHLPSPPFIKAPGIANLRDAGGYPIQGHPGKMVKRGVLFRSADPTKATDEGLAVFKGLGITHVYDFRSAQELKTTPPRDFEGTKRVFVPVFLNTDYSPEALALRFGDYASGPEVSFF